MLDKEDNMYEWNKPFVMVMNIKKDYIKASKNNENLKFESWVEYLNIEKYNDFVLPLQFNQSGNFLLIRYGLADMQKGMWENEDSIYRQCRSVVIDLYEEEPVLTPFRKFFNLNEVKENMVENIYKEIKISNIFEITNKLDGSMQSLRYYNGKYFMSGSMALDKENSWRLEDGYSMLNNDYKRMAKDNKNYTFIFEYISIKDAHVVLYNKSQEGLYLIGIIDVITGNELPYSYVKAFAKEYNIKTTTIEYKSLDEILELSKTMKSNEKEGWVMNIDGHKVKVKCDDYVSLHRLLDKLSSVNLIIESIADDKFDDLISKVPIVYRERVLEISKIVYNYIEVSRSYVHIMYEKSPKENRKEFMIWVEHNVDKHYKACLRSVYLGLDYNLLKGKSGRYKKMSEMQTKGE